MTRTSVVAAMVVALVVTASSVSLALLGRPGQPGGVSDDQVVSGATLMPSAPTSNSTATSPSPSPSASPSLPPAQQVVGAGDPLKRLPASPTPARGEGADTKLRDRAERLLQLVAPTSFRVSSFNLLGAGHTDQGGKRSQFASGATRMRWAMSLLQSAGVSVAGVQEFESPQHTVFQQVAPAWDVFPGTKLSHRALANSVMWRTDVWELVEGHTIDIPYFYGKPMPMPYLLLRHVDTGREVWFANFHNPASVRGPAAQWRREAVSREIALAQRLSASGTPMIMTGDMNDRAEFFCPMTTRTQLHAANGGSTGTPCQPPGNIGIDWVLGSADVAFAEHHAVRGGLVARTTDHPFVWAAASISAPATP